jgi:hypothetical protein
VGVPGTSSVQALGIRRVPYRPAQVGAVVMVDHDSSLLSAHVPAITTKGVSLQAAVRKIAQASNKNIVLGIRGLEEEGISTTAPRDFEVPDGTVKTALLSTLKTATGGIPMVITAEDKVVSIATQAQADNVIVTKQYYLEDLLGNAPRWMAGGTNLQAIGAKYGLASESTDFSKSPYQDDESGQVAKSPPAKPNSVPISTNITELITSSVRPEIWKVNGGKIGEIGVAGDIVVIRAPQSVHALLDGPHRHDPNRVPMYVGYGQ